MLYDEFGQKPFIGCADENQICVVFAPTDDPFFYDKYDRRGTKVTLEEEVLWEQAVEAGSTTSELEEWVLARRSSHPK